MWAGFMKEDQKNLPEKEVAYYSTLLGAWVDTKMEHDKSLLTLSSGGLGLLITLLSTVGVKEKRELILYVFASLCFALTIILCIIIFERNAIYLKKVVTGYQNDDSFLTWLDCLNSFLFVSAIIFSALIGLVVSVRYLKTL